jgi:hypothetical protein
MDVGLQARSPDVDWSHILLAAAVVVAGVIDISGIYPQVIDAEWVQKAAGKHLTFVAEPRKISVVLSPEEVVRFLEAAPGVKYKAALSGRGSAQGCSTLIRSPCMPGYDRG